MLQASENAFSQISKTKKGHFVLYLYAAVYHLLNYIRRLSMVGGQQLETQFKRYPFLEKYFFEMRQYMPDEINWVDGMRWWRHEIQKWEHGFDTHLPVRALAAARGMGFRSTLAFMAVGLVEEDSRFGTLYAELQAPLGHRRPTFELIGQMISANGTLPSNSDAWQICSPLIRDGFVEVLNRQSPRSEWVLRAPPLLWNAAGDQVDDHVASWCDYQQPETLSDIDDLVYAAAFIAKLNHIPHLLTSAKVHRLIMRCDYGSDPLEVIGALAKRLNFGIVSADGKSDMAKDNLKLLGPYCTLTRSVPVLHYDLGPGDTVEPPALEGYGGPVGFVLGLEGGLDTRTVKNSLTLNLPTPNRSQRERYWRQALKPNQIEDYGAVAGLFHLSGNYIRQVADIALANAVLDGREAVKLEDVRQASRSLNRQHLDSLASPLDSKGCWEDLVAAETTTLKLAELHQRCLHRETLLDSLGPAFRNSANRGVRALFTGVSGTGKTLAAKIMASELGLDLYRVDLAAVINKYIGETEKNLHQVLSRAEALDVVLLLDEGDALLGTRTDVKTANDRYANLETNYLLQRLENYQGIVLVTTNLGENIDTAFQRRMDVVVPFFSPQPDERLRIMELHLPHNHRVGSDYLEQVARRCDLTGGQIRNASLHATLLALDEAKSVDQYHLEEALQSEFRKAGGTFPLSYHHANDDPQDDGTEEFVNALRSQ